MPEIDGGTTRYSKTYVTNTNVSRIKANTITVSGDVVMNHFRTTSNVISSTPGGGTLVTIFTCDPNEVGIVGFGQTGGTSLANGGVWFYAYLNGTGYVFRISTTTSLLYPTVAFSGAVLQGYNTGTLSMFWRKMRIN